MQYTVYFISYIYKEKNERKEHKLDVLLQSIDFTIIWEPDRFVKSDSLLIFHKEEDFSSD